LHPTIGRVTGGVPVACGSFSNLPNRVQKVFQIC
jgi:hypothetical protein